MTVIDDSDPNYKSLDEQLAEQRESQNEILAETKKQILHGIATGDADEYILEALGLACVALMEVATRVESEINYYRRRINERFGIFPRP